MPKQKIDVHEVAALKEAGYTTPQLAAEFGCSVRSIFNYLHRAGWVPGDAPPSKDPGEKVLRVLYRERGLSTAQIARRLHVDVSTVTRWIRKHKLWKTKAA